jgi:hypothetical protein
MNNNEVDFSDMPDLVSVPLNSDVLYKDSGSALNSSINDLDPVFISEYQEKKTNISNKSLDEIKRNIEKTVNFNNVSESMTALNNPDILLNRIQNAFDSFKSQTGRTMTYSEMREMMG